MNNLKFRAWDKKHEVICEVLQIHFELGFVNCINEFSRNLYFDDCILMQSTGLKDKNGVEIYEGDIVVTESGKVYIIIRSKTGLYKAVEKNKDEIYYLTLADVCDLLEILGNIYENKELLEN